MPGTPATTPTFAIPRFSNADVADFATEVNSVVDQVDAQMKAALSTYETLLIGGANLGNLTAATFLLGGATGQQQGPALVGGAGTAQMGFYIAPAEWAITGMTTKMRLRVLATSNNVAPAITFTFGLYPIATSGGASGAAATIASVGTVVSGSTVAVASPPASARTPFTGSDFNAPAAGAYVLGFVTTSSMAAGSQVAVSVHVQYRRV